MFTFNTVEQALNFNNPTGFGQPTDRLKSRFDVNGQVSTNIYVGSKENGLVNLGNLSFEAGIEHFEGAYNKSFVLNRTSKPVTKFPDKESSEQEIIYASVPTDILTVGVSGRERHVGSESVINFIRPEYQSVAQAAKDQYGSTVLSNTNIYANYTHIFPSDMSVTVEAGRLKEGIGNGIFENERLTTTNYASVNVSGKTLWNLTNGLYDEKPEFNLTPYGNVTYADKQDPNAPNSKQLWVGTGIKGDKWNFLPGTAAIDFHLGAATQLLQPDGKGVGFNGVFSTMNFGLNF